jgi:hypothetical protein
LWLEENIKSIWYKEIQIDIDVRKEREYKAFKSLFSYLQTDVTGETTSARRDQQEQSEIPNETGADDFDGRLQR